MSYWRDALYNNYDGDVQALIEDMDDDELQDAMDELDMSELREEARARGIPLPVSF